MAERKYAKDYRIEEYTDINGKKKQRRIYQGENYVFEKGPKDIKLLGKTLLAFCAVVFAGLLPLLFVTTQIGRTIYVLLPMAFALLPLFQTAAVGYRLLSYRMPLTRQQKDLTDKRLKICSVFLTALLAVTLLGCVLYVILHGFEEGEIWCAIGIALSLASSFLIFSKRKSAKTVLIEN